MIYIERQLKFLELSSKELDRYEYLTGIDLGYKPGVVKKVWVFGYSPLDEALCNKAKSKRGKRNKVVHTNKKDKNLFYNSHYSFVRFKGISNFKEFSLDSMYKKLNDFHNKNTTFKKVSPQTKINEDLKESLGDLFSKLYYIYKERYNEEKNGLNTKYTKNFDYKTKIHTWLSVRVWRRGRIN